MKHYTGSVELICGSMFSGKTEELIRRVRRAMFAKQTVRVFKHSLDTRYNDEQVITSHNGQEIRANHITASTEILPLISDDTTVVTIDEVQFFNDDVLDVIEYLADNDIRVIVAGLDTDFRGEPFGAMPEIMCRAEHVTKLQAICVVCGDNASRTQRLVNGNPAHYDDPIIMVGAQESDEARCRHCHDVPGSPHLDRRVATLSLNGAEY